MGEYAKRRSDGERVKIGTCADMYYIRFEDRFKVSELPGNVNLASDVEVSSLRFRLPFPDEDHLRPGDYQDYHRFEPLYGEYEMPADVESSRFQMHHESGLLLSVPCFHGVRLPDKPDGWYVHWNGKKASAVLSSVRAAFDEAGTLRLYPVVRCQWCNEQWRESWERIWPLLSKEFQRVCDQYRDAVSEAA